MVKTVDNTCNSINPLYAYQTPAPRKEKKEGTSFHSTQYIKAKTIQNPTPLLQISYGLFILKYSRGYD